MSQIRVAKDVWDKLDAKAQEARKIRSNEVFLNEPAFDENTQEYVWDDPRLTDDHTFIVEECKKLKPTKASKAEDVLLSVETKLLDRKSKSREPFVTGDIQTDIPLQSKPDAESTALLDTKDS